MFKKVFLAAMIFVFSLGVSVAQPEDRGDIDVGSVPAITALA